MEGSAAERVENSLRPATHLPFVQVTSQRLTENTRPGTDVIRQTAPLSESRSCKIVYSGFWEAFESGRVY